MATLATTQTAAPPASRRSFLEVLSTIWAWLFLGLLIITFSMTGGSAFFSLANFQNILANMSILTIIAIGQTYVIISGGIDLSAGWIMGMVSVVSAIVMNYFAPGTSMFVIVLVGSAVGLVAAWGAGLVNGLLVAKLNVPPFIATLGMFGIARGVGFLLSGGLPVPVRVRGIGELGNGYVAQYLPEKGYVFFERFTGLEQAQMRAVVNILPYVLIVMVIALVIMHLVLSRSRFGLHTYAIGGNKEAALRAGIPVARTTIFIYMLSATMAALAGLVYNVRFTNGAANSGESMVLDTVAAVVIGGASLFGGSGTVVGTFIGALIIAVLNNGLVITRVDPYWQFISVGVVIIVAVLIDQAREKLAR